MNRNFDTSIGGASIIPSARKSIHSHENCIFAMGRYGLEANTSSNNINGTRTSTSQAHDEVDNIMSKLAASPLSTKRNKTSNRSSSLTPIPYQDFSDDSDDHCVLAKSLPATLPSHSHYRNEFAEWSQESNNINEHNDSSLLSTSQSSGTDQASYKTQGLRKSSHSSQSDKLSSNICNEKSNKLFVKQSWLYALCIGILSIVVVLFCREFLSTAHGTRSINYDKIKFYKDVSNIEEKYKMNLRSLLQVQTGISTIFDKQDTGSFIFVYNSNNKDFNSTVFNNFMNDIAFVSANYLRNDSIPNKYTSVDSSDLNMQTHSELINKYRDELDKAGVMYIKNLDGVPSNLAMAFHYYCDEYNPLVKKSAIIFTLNMAKCLNNIQTDNKSIHANIEKCLTLKWNDLPRDNIGPLLTRVVNIVVDVTNAF